MRRCQLYQKSSIAQRRPISFMVIKRNRTPSSNISRALYLYPLGLSTRCVQSNILSNELDYDKGKIIHLGLWGHMLAQIKEFIDFLYNEIIPLSLNSTFIINNCVPLINLQTKILVIF